MKLSPCVLCIGLLLSSSLPFAHAAGSAPDSTVTRARGDQADISFGYSRVPGNLFAPNTDGMNGWQFSIHIKPSKFVGVEGDVSHYSQSEGGFSEDVTPVIVGPRFTVGIRHVRRLTLFAHGLGGFTHQRERVAIFAPISTNAGTFVLGGGGDLPLGNPLRLRLSADYLDYSGSRGYRLGVGVAYHF